MRSNKPSDNPKSKTNSSSERTASLARLPLALTALVAVLSVSTPVDAAWFGARGFGGRGPAGFISNRGTGFTGNSLRGTEHSIRIGNPGGKIAKGGSQASDG